MTPDAEDRRLLERVTPLLRRVETPDPTFESRLLAAVRDAVARGEAPWNTRPAVGTRPRGWRWLGTPRRVMISPLAGLAAAAAFAAVIVGTTLVLSRRPAPRPPTVARADDPGQPGGEVVRFIIAAPHARTVALVGDFNGWNASATPLARSTASGVWTVTIPLSAGSYQYAFVVDGTAWMADPSRSLRLRDEFGAPSSLITVGGKQT